MTTTELVAVHKAVPESKYKELAQKIPNDMIVPIDLTAHITGALKRGRPYVKRNAAKANPWKLLAVALSKLNDATIESVVRSSMEVPGDLAKEIKAKAEDAIKQMIDATEQEMSGNITATLMVELLK